VGRRVVVTTLALAAGLVLWSASVAMGSGYSITATCTSAGHTAACSTSWYTSNVFITWAWTPNDGGNPESGCLTHSYAQDTRTTVSCTVSGPAGRTSVSLPINIELSSPTATASPTRPPDSGGWYNHPVTVAFHGSSFSGIRSCTTSTYAGPASPSARVSGSCTDNAGKTAAVTSAPFAYDATRPSVYVAADTGDRVANLNWSMSGLAPAERFRLARQPGLHGKSPSVVYRSSATAFKDTRVRNGVHYLYTVTALDAAGNTGLSTIVAKPGLRLIAPAGAVSLSAPPLLRWTSDRKADYYNVQLYRGNRKVLSAWPKRAGFQLASKWSYRGHRYRLRPGKYRWYVWPGFGRRSAVNYGAAIGSSTFVVTASA
jgi:hypothetical protein